MAFLRTETELASGGLTLVVFAPDAIRSRLVGPIEAWIRERTGWFPVARQWVSHSRESLYRFYPVLGGVSTEDAQRFAVLFSMGPCLATLWFAENGLQTIQNVKGPTHPAHCSSSTIRGSFWCDNPSTNLIHVSDNGDDATREVGVLRSLEPELFTGPLSAHALASFQDGGPPVPRHSAILTLCSLVAEHLAKGGISFTPLALPDNRSARDTMARAEAWLGSVATALALPVAEAVEAYVEGAELDARFFPALGEAIAVDAWAELVLYYGLRSRSAWLEGR